jgi:hypothetical protein
LIYCFFIITRMSKTHTKVIERGKTPPPPLWRIPEFYFYTFY